MFFFLPLSASSIIGVAIVSVTSSIIFLIILVLFCYILAIIKHRKSHIRTNNSQQIELRSAGNIQSNSASHSLAQQPPPAYPQQPPPAYSQQPPAQYPSLIPPGGNTVYPDQEINMEPKTLRTLPPPSYDDLYKN